MSKTATIKDGIGRFIVKSNYVQQLDEWIKTKGLKKADANVAAFLAVREVVKARLDEGYSAAIIHAYLCDGHQIDVCYDTFLRYVHRYVQPPRKGSLAKNRRPAVTTDRLSRALDKPQESPPTTSMSGFVFNANPKREDLL